MKERYQDITMTILNNTISQNRDNISRTVSYAAFFKRNPEIRWAMLASLVSRNAGYSMCDLKGDWLPRFLSKDTRKHLFHTYERANWLIFQDAYPQLLLYEYSKEKGAPLFDLLDNFYVSTFMKKEWHRFWIERDIKRICTSLIINEQHVIENPVIKNSFYNKRIFSGVPFLLQDYMHFSTVLFPVLSGDVYGISVHGFKTVKNRIETGKMLYTILFESRWSEEIIRFSDAVTHTGSRHDFEKYVYPKKMRETPLLRMVYPIVHHHRKSTKDWYRKGMNTEVFYHPVKKIQKPCLTDWYKQKQRQIKIGILLKEWIQNR
ncbi:DUF2515 family protein [Fictibacillus arsenicus]|nr:DUF2515 family protein [Fictibacillus arsenicus]